MQYQKYQKILMKCKQTAKKQKIWSIIVCVKWVCAQERMTNKKVEIHREQYLCSAVAKDVSRLHGAGKRDIVTPCPPHYAPVCCANVCFENEFLWLRA